jgi:hypothetical protein
MYCFKNAEPQLSEQKASERPIASMQNDIGIAWTETSLEASSGSGRQGEGALF